VSAGLHLKLHMPDEALKLGRKDDMLGPPAKRFFLKLFKDLKLVNAFFFCSLSDLSRK